MATQQITRADPPPVVNRLLRLLAGERAEGAIEDIPGGFASGHAGDIAPPSGRSAAIAGVLPFSGSIARSRQPPAPKQLRTRRAYWVAFAWVVAALREGGRAALVAPTGLLHGDAEAEVELRRTLVQANSLHAVLALGPGVVRPRAPAVILALSRGGTTQAVWMHTIDSAAELAELAARWPTEPRFVAPAGVGVTVSREAIEAGGFDLRPERYPPAPPGPHAILHEIATLEAEILQGIRNLVGMLK